MKFGERPTGWSDWLRSQTNCGVSIDSAHWPAMLILKAPDKFHKTLEHKLADLSLHKNSTLIHSDRGNQIDMLLCEKEQIHHHINEKA